MSIHIRRHGEGCSQLGWTDFDRAAARQTPEPPLGGQSGADGAGR